MNDAPAYVRLHATALTMLEEKEYRVYTHTNINTQKWPVLPSIPPHGWANRQSSAYPRLTEDTKLPVRAAYIAMECSLCKV